MHAAHRAPPSPTIHPASQPTPSILDTRPFSRSWVRDRVRVEGENRYVGEVDSGCTYFHPKAIFIKTRCEVEPSD
ncbi:uncharacterized protein H6S33_004508 [Morchella sextelata]|uniref:uncharacterized protein n=1 Tax=Morchella sextelata TaxID=1174677 RepID=UPI001D03C188|nr:uncharacterized protein H6S33_004508 [Morchella sextelata]KAH0606051.1 hypothetical protein H6S33_004508 [Morchella sextelata]